MLMYLRTVASEKKVDTRRGKGEGELRRREDENCGHHYYTREKRKKKVIV